MELVINDSKNQEVQQGDIITYNGNGYLVCKSGEKYIARNFNGSTGLFGHFDTITELSDAFYKKLSTSLKGATLYKSSEYALKLVKK